MTVELKFSSSPLGLAVFRRLRRVCASAGFLIACLFVMPSSANAREVIAKFPNGEVTSDDVDAAMLRQGMGNTPQTRQAVLRAIVAAYAVEDQLTSKGKELPPDLAKALADPRRQMMLDYYLQKQYKATRPSNSDVEDFVNKNPQFFRNRATFRFFQFMIDSRRPDQVASVQSALAQLRSTGKPTVEGVNRFKAALRDQNIRLIAEQLYLGTEQMPPQQLQDLEGLAASRTYIKSQQNNSSIRITVLLDRIPDPVDPDDMRPQIERGLMAQNIQAQRQGLIDSIGASALEALKNRKAEDNTVLDLSGRENPLVNKKADTSNEDGIFLRLFRSLSADPNIGILNNRYKQTNLMVRYAAINLGLIALLTPSLLTMSFQICRAGFHRRRSSSRMWRRRAKILTPVIIAVILTMALALAYKLQSLLSIMGLRSFLTVGLGVTLLGAVLAYVWSRKADDDDVPSLATLTVITLVLASILKFG